MRWRLLVVGRAAQDPLHQAADEYITRLRRWTSFELERLKDQGREKEGTEILRRIPAGTLLVAFDERGREFTSQELATTIRGWQRDTTKQVALVVGGADGLSDAVRQRAKYTWALSRLTLPHRLALVVVVEQLYRAYTIIAELPYHRE